MTTNYFFLTKMIDAKNPLSFQFGASLGESSESCPDSLIHVVRTQAGAFYSNTFSQKTMVYVSLAKEYSIPLRDVWLSVLCR